MWISFPYVFSKNYVEFLYWLSSRKKNVRSICYNNFSKWNAKIFSYELLWNIEIDFSE